MGPTAASVNRRKTKQPANPKLKKFRIFSDKLFIGFLIPAILLSLAVLVVMLVKVRPKDFIVPLQYSTIQGFDALGSWYEIYIYGLFSILVTVGNLVLATFSYEKSRLASFLLVLATVIINLFSLVVVITLVSHLEV